MCNQTKQFYEFDGFRLDLTNRILYHAGKTVALKPKAVETLIVLVESGGEIVSKERLMQAVWQDSVVEENSLSVNIYALRKAFAAIDADKIFIETASRRGFRFTIPIKTIVDGRFVDDKSALEIASYAVVSNPIIETEIAPQKFTESKQSFSLQNVAVFCLISAIFFSAIVFYAWQASAKTLVESNSITQKSDVFETKSIEARQFYLRGRELWKARSYDKMSEGIKFFHRAIEIDPNFVAPYLGIADSLSMISDDAENFRHAEEYALKAKQLAPDSAEVFATLGFIYAMNKWRWREAETFFQHALELDANCGKAHQWYATLLEIERRFDEAEVHLKRAVEIEPLSPNYNADLCELFYFTKRFDEALTQCRRTQEINPEFRYSNFQIAIFTYQKRYDEAMREMYESRLRLGAKDSDVQAEKWFKAYQTKGFRGWMSSDLENYHENATSNYPESAIFAKLNDKEKSIEHLEKAFAKHTFMLPFANAQPEFDEIRDDVRFQNLMSKIGLNRE